MAYDSSGAWKREDDGVANRIAKITAGSSDFMRQARTSGMQTANRRGLGNSSIAVGAAEGAAIDRAAPIASQEASQIARKNEGLDQFGYQTDLDAMRYAAAEREMQARAITDLSGQRFSAFSNTLVNPDIPASARADVQRSINDQHADAMRRLQDLYGVSYVPGSGAGGALSPPPAPPTPTAPPIAGPGLGGATYQDWYMAQFR